MFKAKVDGYRFVNSNNKVIETVKGESYPVPDGMVQILINKDIFEGKKEKPKATENKAQPTAPENKAAAPKAAKAPTSKAKD